MKTNIFTGIGGLVAGALLVYSSTFANGQTVQVYDDGIRPAEDQRILIESTKQIKKVDYDGTYKELVERIAKLEASKASCIDSTDREIAKYTALKEAADNTLIKLPERTEIEDMSEATIKIVK